MSESSTVVILATNRPELVTPWTAAWNDLFQKHNATLVVVYDRHKPIVVCKDKEYGMDEVMGSNIDLIYNRSSAVKNLGIAYACNSLSAQNFIVLDDDVFPVGDTIQDHLTALQMSVPVSWMTVGDHYTRGFPYAARKEAEVLVSHGVWTGIPDYDAASSLVNGTPPMSFYKIPVPKGVFIPVCGMNLAFKRQIAPYIYFAPQGDSIGYHRFDDIWMGISLKRKLDETGKAMVTGYSTVQHTRQSDPFKNLIREATGVEANETLWKNNQHDYWALYNACRERWEHFLKA